MEFALSYNGSVNEKGGGFKFQVSLPSGKLAWLAGKWGPRIEDVFNVFPIENGNFSIAVFDYRSVG